MSNTRRDKWNARKNNPDAKAKREERKEKESKCNLCGTPCRESKLSAGLCPKCLQRASANG
jgi:Zn finger protein HypA/HybF involved in hydrogenase expression